MAASLTRDQVDMAERLVSKVTYPGLVEWRAEWRTAPESEQRTYELGIADYAIEHYFDIQSVQDDGND